MRKLLHYCLFFALLACLPAWAVLKDEDSSQAPHLTLQQALVLADQNNPQIMVARKNLDLSQGDIRIAKEIPNPQLQTANIVGNVSKELGQNNQVLLTQQIETFGKRRKRIQTAQAEFTLTADQLNALRWSIRAQTRQAYAALAAALANRDNIDVQETLAKKLVDIAQTRVTAGAAPMSELLQAKLVLSQLVTQRNQAIIQIKQAREAFNILLGKPLQEGEVGYDISDSGLFKTTSTELVPPIDQEPFVLKDLYQKAFLNRPDLIAAHQQAKVNEALITQAKAQRIPDLFLSAGYDYVDIPNFPPNPRRKYYSGVPLQANINIPLFQNFGPEIFKAKAALSQAQLQILATEKQVQDDIRNGYLAYQLAKENLTEYRNHLIPDSAHTVDLALLSYRYGKTPLSTAILAQQNDQQLRQAYLQTIGSYQGAWATLEQAVGEPLP